MRDLVAPYPCQHLTLLLFYFSCSNGCVVCYLMEVLHCISLTVNDAEYLFKCFFSIYISFVMNLWSHLLPIFYLDWFFFNYWVLRVFFILDTSLLLDIHKYFLPVCRLPFCSLTTIIHRAKVLKENLPIFPSMAYPFSWQAWLPLDEDFLLFSLQKINIWIFYIGHMICFELVLYVFSFSFVLFFFLPKESNC